MLVSEVENGESHLLDHFLFAKNAMKVDRDWFTFVRWKGCFYATRHLNINQAVRPHGPLLERMISIKLITSCVITALRDFFTTVNHVLQQNSALIIS